MDIRMMPRLLVELRWLRQRDGWTRAQLQAHQERELRRLRASAYARSPFYKRFHKGLEDRPLDELPVLTKATLMEHFDKLVTDSAIHLADVEAHLATIRGDERFLVRYRLCATSGSSGRHGLFLFDRDEWAAMLAASARAHEWAGLRVGIMHRMKLATIASTTPWHLSARLGASLRSWWAPSLRLAAGEPLDRIVAQLNAFQPEMLVAYTSMARLLAEQQAAGRLHIAPRLIFPSAEVLTAETRRHITDVWGPVLFNQYVATETGFLAAECRHHHGMHLFEDLIIVEVVDADNRPVPPGIDGGKLLITTLFNRTQPLIRYELSDSLRLAAEPCPDGRPFRLIEDVQGRAEDILRFPGAAGGVVAVQPLLFHPVMDAVPADGWQLVYDGERLRVLLSGARADLDEAGLAEALRRTLVAKRALAPPIQVERVAEIVRGATGKTPLIKASMPYPAPRPAD